MFALFSFLVDVFLIQNDIRDMKQWKKVVYLSTMSPNNKKISL